MAFLPRCMNSESGHRQKILLEGAQASDTDKFQNQCRASTENKPVNVYASFAVEGCEGVRISQWHIVKPFSSENIATRLPCAIRHSSRRM